MHRSVFFTLLFLLSSLFIVGCFFISSPQLEQQAPSDGYGYFTLLFADNVLRAILPDVPQLNQFAVFELKFAAAPSSGDDKTERFRFANSGEESLPAVMLTAGNYNITLNAYLDGTVDAPDNLAARGTLKNILINPGDSISQTITLRALIKEGSGVFNWAVNITASDVTTAIMEIMQDGEHTPESGISVNLLTVDNGGLSLDSGLYNIRFTLEKDGATKERAVWNEILYVYASLTSNFSIVFCDDYFYRTHYNVTFNYNDGITALQSVMHGDTVNKPTPDPSRANYIFGGWYNDSSFTNAYNFDDVLIGDITLFARWVSTVTFNINGGTGTTPVSQTVTGGSSITIPSQNTLSRTGYTFGGWNTKADGTGDNYEADSLYTVTGNVTLYAKWESSACTWYIADPNAITFSIGTAEELIVLAGIVNGTEESITQFDFNGRTIILSADIYLNNIAWTPIGSWHSISGDTFFHGTFDGNGKTINDLYINSTSDYQGLFGSIGIDGVVKNLAVNGNVTGGRYIGGIAGFNSGTIEFCWVTGTITGTGINIGGVIGANNGIIQNCYTTVNVTSSSIHASGVAGMNSGVIQYCYATGSISGSGDGVGGIVGWNNGGIVNSNVALSQSVSRTTNTLAIRRVIGENTGGTITNNYARSDTTVNGNIITSGVGTNTEQGASIDDWDSTRFRNIGFNDPWWTDTRLPSGMVYGDGTEGNPFRVRNEADLRAVGRGANLHGTGVWSLSAHYRQVANIPTLTGGNWIPIGTSTNRFTGKYYGDRFTISGLTSNQNGMFAVIGNGGLVDHLGLLNVNITANTNSIGGIAGENMGIVQNCYTTGTVSGNDNVGGIVGRNTGDQGNCHVNGNYSTATVNGNYAGGIVGANMDGAQVFANYATGTVNGTRHIGGVVGYNYRSRITETYSTGAIRGNENIGGIVGWNNAGTVENNVALNPSLTRASGISSSFGRVAGRNTNGGSLINNFGSEIMTVLGSTVSTDNPTSIHGYRRNTKSQFQWAVWWTYSPSAPGPNWHATEYGIWSFADGRPPHRMNMPGGHTQNPVLP